MKSIQKIYEIKLFVVGENVTENPALENDKPTAAAPFCRRAGADVTTVPRQANAGRVGALV